MRYFFRVEYDGTRYGGWQRQPNAESIQGVLERALKTVLREDISIIGAGRTDAGVHARAQGVHFDFSPGIDFRRCELSLNALLPSDIAVYNFKSVEDSFHARYSPYRREYRYYLCPRKSPLLYKRVWMLFYDIDWEVVKENLTCLMGEHDFAAFCATGSNSKNTVCTVESASLSLYKDVYVISIAANRFIYKMIRSLVGTLIDIGRGKTPDTLKMILDSRDRKRVGMTAPPCGLVLEKVDYDGVE